MTDPRDRVVDAARALVNAGPWATTEQKTALAEAVTALDNPTKD